MASGIIEHEGIVSRVEGDRVYVKITSQSACGTCKAREACGLAEAQEKIVEVTTPERSNTTPQAKALRSASAECGRCRRYIGLCRRAGGAVGGAGRGGRRAGMERRPQRLWRHLAAVGVYYCVLWLFRHKIEHTIHFSITKNY